jgi:CzcA family heavy metal efflux pump
MLDFLIAWSLRNRWLVLLLAVVVTVVGLFRLQKIPVDVFPDLNRPTATLLTEAPGLAPEEVEALVTRPLEYQLIGATGVRRVRSSSGIGLSVISVEFEWDTEIYRARQMVSEKIQLARDRLPSDVRITLAPISSIMGEVMILGLRPVQAADSESERLEQAMRLRTLCEFTVRNRLLAVDGVSQVTVMGGVLRQFQVITSPERLAAAGVTLDQLITAAERSNGIAGGGVMERQQEESLIRIRAQSVSLDEIAKTPVVWRQERALRIEDVADVRFGGPVRRGDGGVRTRGLDGVTGGDAVILAVQKQPGANTLQLSPRIDAALDSLQKELPPDVTIEKQLFRQADFIQSAIDNVVEAIRDGAVWVAVILLLFLANLRTSFITLTAIPLSVLTTILVFDYLGLTINTMTLGGIAVAIGELVDDAIVDIENIFRRLKENRQGSHPKPSMQVVLEASSEVRNSIVYATLIVCLVVLPLFVLSGLEGRMFAPLALAYVVSLFASLVVSLTVTPALASVLLPSAVFLNRPNDSLFVQWLKWIDEKVVRWSLRHPRKILITAALLAFGSKFLVLAMGSEFLPSFQEGTLTVNVQTRPGTSLEESKRIAERTESLLWEIPEIASIARRTGRAEQDEHAEGVNASELEVRLVPHQRPKPGWGAAVLRAIPGLHHLGVLTIGRPHGQVMEDVRDRVAYLPNIAMNVGQPISHRLDHVMSGVRAQIAIKVFGEDLREMIAAAHDIEHEVAEVPGVVDLQVEPQENVKQVRLEVDRKVAADYGLTPGEVARLLETAYRGKKVSTILDGDRFFDLVVWYDEASRSDREVIGQTILDTPSGRKVALSQVARVLDARGPNVVHHENMERRVVVSCNVQGRDLGSTVAQIREAIAEVESNLNRGARPMRIELGGQFEAQQEANRMLFWLFWAVLLGVFLLLWKCLSSWVASLLVLLIHIPLAALGSVAALLWMNRPSSESLAAAPWWQWPEVWASATTLSVAHWVGFITLIGIVSRNGIMMIAHYIHLQRHEGESFNDEMIVRGTLERLTPVLMTALTAILGLIPLALGAGQTGKEILHPLAIVVIGGLIDATLMDQVVTPAAFKLFGRHVYRKVDDQPR